MRSPLSRRGFLAAGSGLAAAAALPAMSGCSTLASADSDPGTLVVHTQLGTTAPGSPTYTAAVKAFEEENPGLRVKNLVNGDDLPQVYETSRLARKEPDVVMVNLYDKTLAWTDVGATVDVKGYLDDWGLRERVLPAALTAWTDDKGRLRAFPYFATNWPVAFNTHLLDRAGCRRRAHHRGPAHRCRPQAAGQGHRAGHRGRQRLDGAEAARPDHPDLPHHRRGAAGLHDGRLQRQPGRTRGHRLLRVAARRRCLRRQGAGADLRHDDHAVQHRGGGHPVRDVLRAGEGAG